MDRKKSGVLDERKGVEIKRARVNEGQTREDCREEEKLFVESDSLDHKLDKLLSHYSTLTRGSTSRTVSASGAHSPKKKDQETLNCLRAEGW